MTQTTTSLSKALPGEHYCKAHQGNTSHYHPDNCTVCRLQAETTQSCEVHGHHDAVMQIRIERPQPDTRTYCMLCLRDWLEGVGFKPLSRSPHE
jgi:hypothetical protein